MVGGMGDRLCSITSSLSEELEVKVINQEARVCGADWQEHKDRCVCTLNTTKEKEKESPCSPQRPGRQG